MAVAKGQAREWTAAAVTGSVLREHQQSFVEQVEAGAFGTVVVSAPPGTGAQTALAAAAVKIAREGRLIVVITHLRIVAEQWVQRLAEAGVTPVHVLMRGTDLRLALSRGSEAWPSHGVIVATTAAITAGSLGKKIDLQPDLLVIDDADAFAPETLDGVQRLHRSSRRTIARVHGVVPAWLSDAEELRWDPDRLVPDRRARYSIDIVGYSVGAEERDLITKAVSFLEGVSERVAPEAVTRYGVRSRLQSLEADAGPHSNIESLATAIWVELQPEQQAGLSELLDQFDDLGGDPRLEVLGAIVKEARNEHRPCVVIVDTWREVGYVLGYLHDTVGTDVGELSDRLLPDQARLVRDGLTGGETVVASAPFIERGEELPNNTVNVWWSPPRNHVSVQARLGVGFKATNVSVRALLPDPPLTDDPLPLVALVEALGQSSEQ
jgi:hypothetical protein